MNTENLVGGKYLKLPPPQIVCKERSRMCRSMGSLRYGSWNKCAWKAAGLSASLPRGPPEMPKQGPDYRAGRSLVITSNLLIKYIGRQLGGRRGMRSKWQRKYWNLRLFSWSRFPRPPFFTLLLWPEILCDLAPAPIWAPLLELSPLLLLLRPLGILLFLKHSEQTPFSGSWHFLSVHQAYSFPL